MVEQKIDIHCRRRQFELVTRKIRDSNEIVPENKVYIFKYLKDSELGKTILKGRKKRIGMARNCRAAQYLIQIDKWFGKAFMHVTVKDMEGLIEKLDKGVIGHKKTGRKYSPETLSGLKSFIKKFWKWLKGNNKEYPPEVDWIDANEEKVLIPALPGLREAVEKITQASETAFQKALVMTLFDSGARPEEFLNLRIKDMNEVEPGVLGVHIRYSKTFARKVSLPIATTYLKAWLDEHPRKHSPQSQIFPYRRSSTLRDNINRLTQKALGIKTFPYMFRHTSATYYCTLIDRATLCKRFGWRYSSEEPDRYIDFAQIHETKTIQAIRNLENREPDRAAELQKQLHEQMLVNHELMAKLGDLLLRLGNRP